MGSIPVEQMVKTRSTLIEEGELVSLRRAARPSGDSSGAFIDRRGKLKIPAVRCAIDDLRVSRVAADARSLIGLAHIDRE